MLPSEIKKLVNGTADPAYVLDPNGHICAWNDSAVQLFAKEESEVVGRPCAEVLHGVDECGRECSNDCSILRLAQANKPLKNYDIRINGVSGETWCNASVVIVDQGKDYPPYTLHILRPIDKQKRLEILVREFASGERPPDRTSPSEAADLTAREIEILKLLAAGRSTAEAAESLFISRTTASNHIQHAMKKLNAHTRLEAIRRAEKAGLI